MQLNVDTIKSYLEETKKKIAFLQTDIQTYEYRIHHDRKEIATLEHLIEQYRRSIKILEDGDGNMV
jgi:chromosome segregation ATPase